MRLSTPFPDETHVSILPRTHTVRRLVTGLRLVDDTLSLLAAMRTSPARGP